MIKTFLKKNSLGLFTAALFVVATGGSRWRIPVVLNEEREAKIRNIAADSAKKVYNAVPIWDEMGHLRNDREYNIATNQMTRDFAELWAAGRAADIRARGNAMGNKNLALQNKIVTELFEKYKTSDLKRIVTGVKYNPIGK